MYLRKGMTKIEKSDSYLIDNFGQNFQLNHMLM